MSWNLLNDNLYDVLYKEAASFDPDLLKSGFNNLELSQIPDPDRMGDVVYGAGKTVLGAGRGARNKILVRGGKAGAMQGRIMRREKMYKQNPASQLLDNARTNVPEKIVEPASTAGMVSTGDYMNKTGSRLMKIAGLFLKPSDLADHTNLANVLENTLSGGNQSKMFSKEAATQSLMANTRLHGALIGGVAAGASVMLKRQYTDPVPMPPPQQPKGVIDKAKYELAKANAEADKLSREHPVSTTLGAMVAGAAAGAYMNPKRIADVLTRHKRPVPRI